MIATFYSVYRRIIKQDDVFVNFSWIYSLWQIYHMIPTVTIIYTSTDVTKEVSMLKCTIRKVG